MRSASRTSPAERLNLAKLLNGGLSIAPQGGRIRSQTGAENAIVDFHSRRREARPLRLIGAKHARINGEANLAMRLDEILESIGAVGGLKRASACESLASAGNARKTRCRDRRKQRLLALEHGAT